MHIAVLGTGMVGTTLGTALVGAGHHVTMGSRTSGNVAARDWAAGLGSRAEHATFATAAHGADVLVNATAGEFSLAALASLDAKDLHDKPLLDVANPTEVSDRDSLAERLQRAHPTARVVKTLNTMSFRVMAQPSSVPGTHRVFVCGNDGSAKATTSRILVDLGWPPMSILDLGDLASARATESLIPLWRVLRKVTDTSFFNLDVRW